MSPDMGMRFEGGWRIEPVYLLDHTTRVARWRRGHPGTWSTRSITLGRLPDGTWYVSAWTEIGDHAFRDEAHADRAVGELMALAHPRPSDADWQLVPEPGWVLVDGRWRPA